MTHGTATGWRYYGCRCPRCHAALLAEAKVAWAVRQLRRGRDPASHIPVDRVRRHLERLLAAGVKQSTVAHRAQVSPSTITRIKDPHTRFVSRIVARSVLSVAP